MLTGKLTLWLLLAAAALLPATPASAEVAIDWITVGDPGNACDPQAEGCFGSVAGSYRISKFEVTNAQYAEFLNAVAATDTNALYHLNMGSSTTGSNGGITRSGSSGSFSYSAIAGREDMPVGSVSFWDATRFANWLHNGQPTGAQDSTTTEDGAYTLTATNPVSNTVMRNADAQVFVPSEDEWYKAAYYDALSTSYFDFPMGTDTQTVCTLPGETANTANCTSTVVGDLTDVGSYTGSPSPSGTFDQGGNAQEWNEAVIQFNLRGVRGGSVSAPFLAASSRPLFLAGPSGTSFDLGFLIAMLPEPAGRVLQLMALVSLVVLRRHRG